MIRTLMATTAIATLLATGAVAQTGTTTTAPTATPLQEPVEMVVHAEGHLATDLIGKAVYNGSGEEAENIGEVNDIVLNKDGEATAIVVGVGGFLGIGQKEVALEYELVEWAERDGERWLVVETSAEALESQAEFDRSAFKPMPANADVAETKPASRNDLATASMKRDEQDEAVAANKETDVPSGAAQSVPTDDTMRKDDGEMAKADELSEDMAKKDQARLENQVTDDTRTAAIERSTLKEMPLEKIRTENLVGTTVYGANEENIGEVGDVIVSQDGKVDAIIIDVGGFLGIGEKEVAVGMDNLAFMSDDGGSLYLYTEFTQEELEQPPAYDESTYAERRNDMRLRVR